MSNNIALLINHKISFVIMKITAILDISKIDSE
jgi:hypothetical protein